MIAPYSECGNLKHNRLIFKRLFVWMFILENPDCSTWQHCHSGDFLTTLSETQSPSPDHAIPRVIRNDELYNSAPDKRSDGETFAK